jgi:hypothetical protein
MPVIRNDLLSNTRTLLRWGFYIDIGFVVLLALVLVAVFVGDPTHISINTSSLLTPEQQLFAARAGIAGSLACCLLGLPVLRWALAIVNSAGSGDPFVPENGARLRRIGWLLFAINIAMTMTLSLALRSRMRTELQETI